MDLKNFVATVLTEICEGIALAKSSIDNGAIATTDILHQDGKHEHVYSIEKIDFEVHVLLESADTTSKTVGFLKVISASIGGSKEEYRNEGHKISFSVPYTPALINLTNKNK